MPLQEQQQPVRPQRSAEEALARIQASLDYLTAEVSKIRTAQKDIQRLVRQTRQ